ncbi:hypothetical protein [Streptomyces agglomeratus]|uniref:hypothetical protein n=1 Tax=Streptomyces agglomeratus TaxID=285458 RepID=UPI00114CC578|nr:hypothetical protein [Streptomyces agglomeratus]
MLEEGASWYLGSFMAPGADSAGAAMSCSSLAESSALRLTKPRVTAPKAMASAPPVHGNGKPPVATSVGPAALSQLVTFIPTEMLAVYVSLETAMGNPKAPKGGLVCQADFSAWWLWLFGGSVLATAALTTGLSYRKQKEANASDPFRFPFVEVGAASAAFVIWALSLPSTPLRDFCGYKPQVWSPVILLLGTLGIATLLYVFGKTVRWAKVLTE